MPTFQTFVLMHTLSIDIQMREILTFTYHQPYTVTIIKNQNCLSDFLSRGYFKVEYVTYTVDSSVTTWQTVVVAEQQEFQRG